MFGLLCDVIRKVLIFVPLFAKENAFIKYIMWLWLRNVAEMSPFIVHTLDNMGLCMQMIRAVIYRNLLFFPPGRCSMIVHVEYRCPECDKVFNCPANLASHRRWHKPKPTVGGATNTIVAMNNNNNSNPVSTMEENNNKLETGDGAHPGTYTCEFCCKSFKRPNSLRKHILQVSFYYENVKFNLKK